MDQKANEAKRKMYKMQHWKKNKRKRNYILESGLKGFICTCGFAEKECVREAYNILNEYAEKFVEEKEAAVKEDKTDENGEEVDEEVSEEEDVDKALQKEIDSLQKEGKKNVNFRRFQVVDTGVKNCIFIRTTVQDPGGFVHQIMKDVAESKKQKTRHLLRILPVEITCKPYVDDVKRAADAVVNKYFSKDGKTFCILFRARNNSNLSRDDIIPELAEMIKLKNPLNKVDLTQPELVILVEVLRGICCIGVATDYYKLSKYNLVEMCTEKGKTESKEDLAVEKGNVEDEGKIQPDGDKDPGADNDTIKGEVVDTEENCETRDAEIAAKMKEDLVVNNGEAEVQKADVTV